MLIIGLSGVALSIGAFGVQHSFVGLIVARCLGGALNGNVAYVHVLLHSSHATSLTLLAA